VFLNQKDAKDYPWVMGLQRASSSVVREQDGASSSQRSPGTGRFDQDGKKVEGGHGAPIAAGRVPGRHQRTT